MLKNHAKYRARILLMVKDRAKKIFKENMKISV